MNDHISFTYQGREVRTAGTPDKPLFVAADVCRVLELSNVTDALARLDDDERTLVSIEGASNKLPVNAVTESGLYSLILGSRKPQARDFKRWVTHEVLPAIRKTGRYETPTPTMPDLSDPLTTAIMLQDATMLYIEAETARRAAETRLVEQAPAVAFARKVELSPVDISIGTFAKVIGWGPNKLHEELRRRGYLFRRDGHPVPKQRFIEAGLFTVKEVPKGDRVFPVTAITGRGQLRIAREIGTTPQSTLTLTTEKETT